MGIKVKNIKTGEVAIYTPDKKQPNIPKGWVTINSGRHQESLNGKKIWGATYRTADGKTKKVYFRFDGDFSDAETELDALIPEPYTKAKVLGSYSTEAELKRDGFVSLDSGRWSTVSTNCELDSKELIKKSTAALKKMLKDASPADYKKIIAELNGRGVYIKKQKTASSTNCGYHSASAQDARIRELQDELEEQGVANQFYDTEMEGVSAFWFVTYPGDQMWVVIMVPKAAGKIAVFDAVGSLEDDVDDLLNEASSSYPTTFKSLPEYIDYISKFFRRNMNSSRDLDDSDIGFELKKLRTEATEAYSRWSNMKDPRESWSILNYLVRDAAQLRDRLGDMLNKE